MLARIRNLFRPKGPEPPLEERQIRLGGRVFESIGESTIEHDDTFHTLAARANLYFHKEPWESADEFAARIVLDVTRSGQLIPLLGWLIIPAGLGSENWSPAIAEQTSTFIKGLWKPEDKAVYRSLCSSLLMDFFRSGRVSIWTSPMSSETRPTTTRPYQPPGVDTASGTN